jgi:hypothetical protein
MGYSKFKHAYSGAVLLTERRTGFFSDIANPATRIIVPFHDPA